MFEEAQLYAPVTQGADGAVEVQLAADHPGVNDPVYRARRNAIAALAMAWTPGEPIPHAEYTDEEQDVWRQVVPRADRPAPDAGVPRVPGRRRPAAPARRPHPAARRGHRVARAADRVPLRAGRRSGPAPRVLRLARRQPLLLDPVHPAPLRAAVHPRARRRARGRRARELPGQRPFRHALPRGGRGGPTGRAAGRAGVRLEGLLVLAGVRRAARGRHGAYLRRRAALVLRGDPGDRPTPTCARSTSPAWACRRTTSRTTSRCCSARIRSSRSRTSWAASSTTVDDDAVARLLAVGAHS